VVSVALDEELRREVALKEILEAHADHPLSRARFVLEAEITGQLEHPGIVPVYGLGTNAAGRPFYAMRFIRGQSLSDAITRFHQLDQGTERGPGERSLALRELLGQFVAVCNAVAYAHRRGVIHRDLKPANVMLGDFGETLVVDWGLARLLERDPEQTALVDPVRLSPGGQGQTRHGQVVGTPAFMPPEQASGRHDRVGVASDVFALGATLYCLLTGQVPYAAEAYPDKVQRGEFTPPRRVNQRVPRALEAVCLKAMALEPAGRYASARALVEDVERWLAGEPVSADRERLVERAARWARRHRTAVSVGVSLLAAAVVGLTAGLWAVGREQRQTKWERDRAQENLERAEANLELARKAVDECFLIAQESPLLQQPNLAPVKRLLLEKALPFYERFRLQRANDPGLLAVQAGNQLRVGIITKAVGRKSDARRPLEEARALFERLAREQPGVPDHRAHLAATHHNRAMLWHALGKTTEAVAASEAARALRQRLVEEYPSVAAYRSGLAETLGNLAGTLAAQGKRAEGLKACRAARDLQERLVEEHPDVVEYRHALAMTYHNLAAVQHELEQPEEAMKSHEAARDLLSRLVREHPERPEFRQGLAATHTQLGILLASRGWRDDAVKSYAAACDLLRRLIDGHPGIALFRHELAGTLLNQSVLLAQRGERAAGLAACREALGLWQRLLEEDPGVLPYTVSLARSHYNLGAMLSAGGKPDEALKSYATALRLQKRIVQQHPEVAAYRQTLAGTLHNQALMRNRLGQRDEALRSCAEARGLFEGLAKGQPGVPAYRLELARTLGTEGFLHFRGPAPARSLPVLARALAELTAAERLRPLGPEGRELRFTFHGLRGQALAGLGRHQEALADLDRAVALAPPPIRAAMRRERALAQAHAGLDEAASEEAARQARGRFLSGRDLYDLARILAVCAGGATQDSARPLPVREQQHRLHAAEAVRLLRRASDAGFFRTPTHRKFLRTDPDLAALRDRADFRRLLADLERAAA
jgi:serine/threonine-protein kinase